MRKQVREDNLLFFMFFLSLIEHTLRLSPHLLDLPLSEAIKGELESLFLDKVVANLGLCIFVNDIRSIDGGFVFPGVEFRLVMFGLFVEDIITAKLKRIGRQWLKKLCSTKSMLTVNESFPGPVIRIHRGDKVYVIVQNEGDYGVTKKEETVRHGVKQTRNPWYGKSQMMTMSMEMHISLILFLADTGSKSGIFESIFLGERGLVFIIICRIFEHMKLIASQLFPTKPEAGKLIAATITFFYSIYIKYYAHKSFLYWCLRSASHVSFQ
ncbi:uncharacterized protein LOC117931133 isoform X3 [Vitis riparia]|uniref:uncharacterized protein LOC117931133 isoform X3 n=1 Tax=Vitis riparia TaxID=96939 RepID=UPI00155A5393|nr:uncharacterized protein LOC117931133 isoform X3 [Vitis riparia]